MDSKSNKVGDREQKDQDAPPPPYTPEQAGSSNTNTSVVTNEGGATEQTRLNSKPPQSYTATNTYTPTPNLSYSPPTNRGIYQAPETVVLTAAVPLEALRTEPVVTTCPHCRQVVLSSVRFEVGGCTWLTSFVLLFLGIGGGCCLIPFCISDLKDSYHSCPNCGKIMAKYSRLDGKVFRYRG